jgi:hypothetical protein
LQDACAIYIFCRYRYTKQHAVQLIADDVLTYRFSMIQLDSPKLRFKKHNEPCLETWLNSTAGGECAVFPSRNV